MNLVGFGVWVAKFPHDFLLFVYLEDFNFFWIFLAVAANYGISVGESLSAARIRKVPTVVVVVANPGHRTVGSELDGLVAMGQIDESVPIRWSNRGERPVFGISPPSSGRPVLIVLTILPEGVYSFTLKARR